MRTLWASLFTAWLAVTPASAEVTDSDRDAIEETVRGQMQAFRQDDAGTAYGFASRTVQQLFPTPALFLEMVRRAYQPVYRPAAARFRPPEETGSGLVQPVVVQGPDGRFWLARYAMQRQVDGSFLIDGCTLEALPDTGA